MTNQTVAQLEAWIGRMLVDSAGDDIGTIADIYADDETGEPEWLAVDLAGSGNRLTFIPIKGSSPVGDGLMVPYSRAQIIEAPSTKADGHLSQDEEARLYSHYGFDYSQERSDSGLPAGGDRTAQAGGTDDAMTRSEEELQVGKTSREAGRVRLRKWVDVERVETTVPVAREEVRVEREPITDANVDRAMSGAEISEAEHEVVLHEEEAVAGTRVTPKERIRLDKDVVVDEEQVGADLRKERVEVQGDTPRR